MKAMIFAAGLGTRLRPFTNNHPKALAEVNGKTLLEHAVKFLQTAGITEVVVNIHHFPDQVRQAILQHASWGSNITLSDETSELLETGGGLLKAMPHFAGEEAIVVINVDILTNLHLPSLLTAHLSSGAMATLAVMKRESSRHLLFDNNMQLCGWKNNKTGETKTARETGSVQPFAFSGIQIVSTRIFDNMPFSGKFSMIDLYLYQARCNTILGYDHSGDLLIDVGKPGSVEAATTLFSKPSVQHGM